VVIQAYLREALSARFHSVDFAPYFAFLKSLPETNIGHKHHILPRKEFPEFAKDPKNIIRLSPADHFKAHYHLALCAPDCGSFQVAFYMMARFKYASQVAKDELPRYTEIYKKGRVKQAAAAKARMDIYGQTYGRMAVESGQLAKVCTLEVRVKGGQIAGRIAVKNGHIQELGRKWGTKNLTKNPDSRAKGGRIAGRINGLKNVESGQIQELGRVQGRKNSESGHMQRIGKIGGAVVGPIQGRKNVENGHLAQARTTALHIRWHINRGVINPHCEFCHV
jgi:hypothetical protein